MRGGKASVPCSTCLARIKRVRDQRLSINQFESTARFIVNATGKQAASSLHPLGRVDWSSREMVRAGAFQLPRA